MTFFCTSYPLKLANNIFINKLSCHFPCFHHLLVLVCTNSTDILSHQARHQVKYLIINETASRRISDRSRVFPSSINVVYYNFFIHPSLQSLVLLHQFRLRSIENQSSYSVISGSRSHQSGHSSEGSETLVK